MKLITAILLPPLALSLAVCASCGFNSSPGDGEKVGQIVKLANTGMIYKTWEAEIIRGGFQGASGVNGTAFDFTIESPALADTVRAYMEAQREVRITYRSEGIWRVGRSDTGHFLTTITPVTKP